MHSNPRVRRLYSDRRALEQLQLDSTIFRFSAVGEPSDYYRIQFRGRGLARTTSDKPVFEQNVHEVHIRLGANYPRVMPDLSWKTPIFHPNVSASGFICLGGYGTHWVPGVSLEELCHMLWDMIRYENFDVASPYNREAAKWVTEQRAFRFPLDHRPLRDNVAAAAVLAAAETATPARPKRPASAPLGASVARRIEPAAMQPARSMHAPPIDAGVIFLDDQVLEAEIISGAAITGATSGPLGSDADIVFLN